MLKIIKNILTKLILLKILIITFIISVFNYARAEVISEFIITGNDRVSDETIIMFSNLNLGQDVNSNILNEALKELYYTNYFENVFITQEKDKLIIKVEENPIIQEININGIKKRNILEKLDEITKKTEKYPFVENNIEDQVKILKNVLRSIGYYFVEISTEVVEGKNNTVTLNHNVKLGEIAKIKKIKFIGDKKFKDKTLRNVIVSEEDRFWKFITRNKFLDQNRVDLDTSNLLKFYKNRGYFASKVTSTSALLLEDNNFQIIFKIDAGEKFYFNNISINKNNQISTKIIDDFNLNLKKYNGKKYSQKKVNKIIDNINQEILSREFIFLNAKFNEIVKNNNKIDIEIFFNDFEKSFVKRINVLGNYITEEKVIRNSLIVDEGDPYNKILFDKSISDIKAKNIFKTVNYSSINDNDNNKVIDIKVEEKPTGEIFAGAGTGTTGSTISAGIKENNYLGRGIKLDTNLTISDDQIKGRFSVFNPNIANTDKSLNTTLESTSADFMSTSGYKTSRTGFSFGTGFEQYEDLFVNLELSNYYENLETSSKASATVKKQEGDYFENLLKYSIVLNKLDQYFQPTDGHKYSFTQILPIYSEDWSIENKFLSTNYHSLSEEVVLSARFMFSAINSFDEDVRISKRVHVPGRYLRGFESGKIGPKDGTQYVGGNYASSLNLSTTLPNAFFSSDNIDFNLFLDMANVWEVDYNSSLDSNKIRSSTGISMNWFTTIGPISFSYALPLSEAKTDIKEKFRFQIGTSF